ncbi:mitochondrial K+-H+ exchange-related-domain-containing protein [Cladochytrium replicatum]|nr:mitochondrial K+-H+ exchange-related-domain-containing protein [Cladochytrium replicatum]
MASKRTLQVLVLPTLHDRMVFHARFLPPRNPLERHATIAAYIFRKWRFSVADTVGFYWHGFGAWANAVGTASLSEGAKPAKRQWARALYSVGNRMTTRRAADEYFLKMVPLAADHVEFVYPPSLNSKQIQTQLAEWLAASNRHSSRFFVWSLLFPVDFYIAKFYLLPANLFFTYNCFRVISHWRAAQGARTLASLFNVGEVTWTPSEDLENRIRSISDFVTGELKKEGDSGATQRSSVWTWTPLGDVHDEVLIELEKELKAAELWRSYRRARMQYFVFNGRDIQ